MKYIWLLLSIVLFIAVGCQKESKEAATKQAPATQALDITADMLAITVDPNCGMDLRKAAIKDTTVYQGKLYGFCSAGCKTAFLKNPEEKLAKLNTQ